MTATLADKILMTRQFLTYIVSDLDGKEFEEFKDFLLQRVDMMERCLEYEILE